jgi:hypothetical protein
MDEQVKLKEGSTQKHDQTPAARDAERLIPWEKPCMDDVSEQVTAQPYIRFT